LQSDEKGVRRNTALAALTMYTGSKLLH